MMTSCMLSPILARGGMQQDTEVINTPMIMQRYSSFVNLDTSGITSKIIKLIKIQQTWALVLGTSCFCTDCTKKLVAAVQAFNQYKLYFNTVPWLSLMSSELHIILMITSI